MTPSEFEYKLVQTGKADIIAAEQINATSQTPLNSSLMLAGDNLFSVSSNSSGTYGKNTSDGWSKLCCLNVTVGYKASLNGDGFLSASETNIRTRSNSILNTVTFLASRRGVNIYDNGLILYIWQVGKMTVYDNSGNKLFDMDNHSMSVYCTLNDRLWY